MSTKKEEQASELSRAAEDYRQHNSAENQAAHREQLGQARTNGHAAGGAWRSHR